MLRRALPALLAIVPVAACTPTIAVDAAAGAADPACAPVMLALPTTLGEGLDRAQTTAQATAAWGTGGAAVTLRCGVEPPGPSAQCQQVDSGSVVVDWIVQEGADGTWRFTTYGREPAVEVTIPPAVRQAHSSAFVADLGQAVSRIEATKSCT